MSSLVKIKKVGLFFISFVFSFLFIIGTYANNLVPQNGKTNTVQINGQVAENNSINNSAPKDAENLDSDDVKSVEGYKGVEIFKKNIFLLLPRNTTSYWFNIPAGTVIGKDCYLDLNMTVSTTLIDYRSSITLLVNGTYVETKWINDVVDNHSSNWKVSVPSELLNSGRVNELTIVTAQRSIEGDCADIDNPGNWVRFDSSSRLYLSVEKDPDIYLGNLYSVFYNYFDSKSSMKNEYIIPKNYEKSALENMMKVASSVGRSSDSDNVISSKVSVETAIDNDLKNKFYIGTIDKFQNGNVTLPEKPLKAAEGFLSVNDKNVLISGNDEDGLAKAVKFFSSPNYLNEIMEKNLIVKSDINDVHTGNNIKNDTGFYRFKNFGYDTINLKGAFHQSTFMSFKQPGGIKGGDDSYINVIFRHSKALMSDNSLLTIYINNTAIDSVKLSASNSERGNLKVKIPEEALNDEEIEVRIEVYNYIGKVDCSKDYSDTAWTVIDKESEIYFEPNGAGVKFNLRNFPNFETFSNNNNSISVCIADKNDLKTLSFLSILATRIGQMNEEDYSFSVFDSSDDISKNVDDNYIFMGTFDNIWLPDEVKENLGISFSNGNIEISDDLPVSEEVLNNKLIFQVIRSPWNFNKKIYVLAFNNEMKDYAIDFLKDKKNLVEMDNQISIANKNGKISNYEYAGPNADKSEDKAPLTFERIKYIVEDTTHVPFWFVIAAIILIIVFIFILIKVSLNKSRFSKAAQSMKETNSNDDEEYEEEFDEENFEFNEDEETEENEKIESDDNEENKDK